MFTFCYVLHEAKQTSQTNSQSTQYGLEIIFKCWNSQEGIDYSGSDAMSILGNTMGSFSFIWEHNSNKLNLIFDRNAEIQL